MAAKPEVELLGNGDILVPVEDAIGGWRVSRVVPTDTSYADWLKFVQQRDRPRALDFWTSGMFVWIATPAVLLVLVLMMLLVVHVLATGK